jgi:hypothetical protein
MALPTVRAVGTISSGSTSTAATPGLPSGTVAGDFLLMFIETDNQDATASGWTEAPSSPQTADTASASDTRLTVLYRIAQSGRDATTTNAPGEHISARIIGITAGTYDTSNPFHQSAGGTDTTSDTSGSGPAVTTTLNDCLIIAACSNGNDPAANGTANYTISNASLGSVTERIDNTRIAGNGGGFGVISGTLATAGSSGNTTFTLAVASLKGMLTYAIAPARPIRSPTRHGAGPQVRAISAM